MKRVFAFSFSLMALLNLFGQKQKMFFEIGDKKIFFETEEKIAVWRTVCDTLISCKDKKSNIYSLGTFTTYAEIPPTEFKTLKREIFNDNGCIWTRITNDELREEVHNPITNFNLLYDSVCFFTRPSPCFRHDTVMQINPVTLEEIAVYSTDSISTPKFNVGNISKRDLCQAISSQLGLNKNEFGLRLKSLTLEIFNDTCADLTVNYHNPIDLESELQKINAISEGTHIIISGLGFDDTNGRTINNSIFDLTLLKVIE